MAVVKAVFLLPVQDNDGSDLTAAIDEVRNRLFALFGGWTLEGSVSGSFRMPDGSEKIDVCAKHMVFLDESRLPELEQVLRDFKAKTTQAAIYLEVQRDAEIRLL
jgi:hypothetical protein